MIDALRVLTTIERCITQMDGVDWRQRYVHELEAIDKDLANELADDGLDDQMSCNLSKFIVATTAFCDDWYQVPRIGRRERAPRMAALLDSLDNARQTIESSRMKVAA